MSDDETEEDEDNSERDGEDHTVYKMTASSEWKKVGGRTRGRAIEPIPFTGENDLLFHHLNVQFTNTIHLLGDNDLFTVKIAEEELEALKDSQGNIRYAKVFEWLLP